MRCCLLRRTSIYTWYVGSDVSFNGFWPHPLLLANQNPSLEMENEEKIRLEARRRLEEQLRQYRVQRHKERVSGRNPRGELNVRLVTYVQLAS